MMVGTSNGKAKLNEEEIEKTLAELKVILEELAKQGNKFAAMNSVQLVHAMRQQEE
jgi:hypothetical protein